MRCFSQFVLSAALATAAVLVSHAAPTYAFDWPHISNPIPHIDKTLLKLDQARLSIQKKAAEHINSVNNEIQRLIREAQNKVNRVSDLENQINSRLRQIDEVRRLVNDPRQYEASLRRLVSEGLVDSNRNQVLADLKKGTLVFVSSKEINYIEYAKLCASIGEAAATGNPGPVLAYVQGFLAESKATVLNNLRNVPANLRPVIQNEVEQLLLGAINQAAKGGQQAPFRYRGLNMVAGVASFNHWVTVKYSWPRIHETGRKFGIPIYEIIMDQHSVKIPLPNTHLPYLAIRPAR